MRGVREVLAAAFLVMGACGGTISSQHDAGADTAGMGDAVTTADALGDATGLGDGTIGEAGLPTTAPWLPTVHSPRALPRSILAMLGSRTTLLMCGLRMLKRARWLP